MQSSIMIRSIARRPPQRVLAAATRIPSQRVFSPNVPRPCRLVVATQQPRYSSSKAKKAAAAAPKEPSKKQLARAESVYALRKTFHFALGSDLQKIRTLADDSEIRDLLWNQKSRIQGKVAGRSWEAAYVIARRLVETDLFLEPPDKEKFLDAMLADRCYPLTVVEGSPARLTAEVKMLKMRDKQSKNKGSAEPTEKDDDEGGVQTTSELKGAAGKEEDTKVSGLIGPDDKPTETAAGSQYLVDIKIPSFSPLKLGSTSTTAGLTEEEAAQKAVDSIQVQEDPKLSEKMEKLMTLSKTLNLRKRRPDLIPGYYPNQARFALLAEATTLLEEACYNYVAKVWPKVVESSSYDCPEAQEFKVWTELMKREFNKRGATVKTPAGFLQGSNTGDIIRNAAAHRTRIDAPKVRVLLSGATEWVRNLGDIATVTKLSRLEGAAKQMHEDVDQAVKPVSAEILKILDKISARKKTIADIEAKIKELQAQLRAEEKHIQGEEDSIEAALREEEAVRSKLGKALKRTDLHYFVHHGKFPPEEKEETEDPADITAAEEESAAGQPVQERSKIELPDEIVAEEELKDKLEHEGEGKEPRGAASGATIEVTESEIEAMLASEDLKFNEFDKKHIRRDASGLISSSNKTLQDVEDHPAFTPFGLRRPVVEDTTPKPEAEVEPKPEAEEPKSDGEKGSQPTSSFEGTNLSRDAIVDSAKERDGGPKWYNPLTWFR
ncbi:hypothetical protein ABW19_dt0210130 [Dactylella cylindrospora]|nr:hypothetical protein ABW19_dt0210130 [Dactylella cylindrospora]